MPKLQDLPTRSSRAMPVSGLRDVNLTSPACVTSFTLADFLDSSVVMSEEYVDGEPKLSRHKIAQRNLDQAHAKKLSVYLIKALCSRTVKELPSNDNRRKQGKKVLDKIGDQPYFALQPFVACLSDANPDFTLVNDYPNFIEGTMERRNKIEIIDGNHRRAALAQVSDWLDSVVQDRVYPTRGPIKKAELPSLEGNDRVNTIAFWAHVRGLLEEIHVIVVMHIGLDTKQQRQLFHDMNNLVKRVDKEIAYKFDESNPVNLYTKELTESRTRDVSFVPTISSRDITDWQNDNGGIARKDVVTASSLVLSGKASAKSVPKYLVSERSALADRFWSMYGKIDGIGKKQSRLLTVAAQPVMLKALARLVFEVAYNKKDGDEKAAEAMMVQIPKGLDFSHDNELWDVYNNKSIPESLKKFLPPEEGVNRDIGQRDAIDKMRFGAKHNDIRPILIDLLRYQLGLAPKKRRASGNRKKS